MRAPAMHSSCASGRRAGPGCSGVAAVGFTLMELLLALAIIGLVAGLVAAGVGRASLSARQRDTVLTIAQKLNLARLEAMRTQRPVDASLTLAADRFTFKAAKSESFPARGLTPLGQAARSDSLADLLVGGIRAASPQQAADSERAAADKLAPLEAVGVRYDSRGLTAERTIRFGLAPAEKDRTPEAFRTIWEVRFDPISGVASAEHPSGERPESSRAGTPKAPGVTSAGAGRTGGRSN